MNEILARFGRGTIVIISFIIGLCILFLFCSILGRNRTPETNTPALPPTTASTQTIAPVTPIEPTPTGTMVIAPAVIPTTFNPNKCADFSSQSEAQQWWEENGRPEKFDRDGDGIVCEDLS